MKYPGLSTCYCYDKNNTDAHELKENGFERVKRMYRLDNIGMLSPEMYYLIQSGTTSVIVAGLAGAVIHMMKVRHDYFRRNTETQFESQYLAKRKLTDTMTVSGFKGGIKYAVKYGSFSSLYLLSTMTVANYNNKITVWEHIGTGATLGAIFRINFGLKGMAAAATTGGFLGLMAGGILVIGMWLSNTTLEDLHGWQHANYYKEIRKMRNKPEF